MLTSVGWARRLACSGAPLGLAVVLVAFAASPGFIDPFTSVKWYALEAVAAGWLVSEQLLCRGIIVRDCSSFRGCGERCLRVTIGRREENDRFLVELEKLEGKKLFPDGSG